MRIGVLRLQISDLIEDAYYCETTTKTTKLCNFHIQRLSWGHPKVNAREAWQNSIMCELSSEVQGVCLRIDYSNHICVTEMTEAGNTYQLEP